ncbi:hypothetical protein FIBSPDRAFT_899865 [Athelia psychrophila]|uniref:Uncharacterized protein n=1 Tax=Athelia psychrophila TaxID=1759441 RepID=A0A165Z671_9AGAM|nr:hypothetical protein FIBSPDRAFT_899865 [Fibularhizoctonia sp. CBS 109695]
MKRSDPRRSAGWRSGSGSHKRIGRKRRDTDDKLVNSKASTHTKGGSWRSDIRQDKKHRYGTGRVGGEAADSEVSLIGHGQNTIPIRACAPHLHVPHHRPHTSAFSCPLCHTFADLEEDVEIEPKIESEEDQAPTHMHDIPYIDIDRAGEADSEEMGEGDLRELGRATHIVIPGQNLMSMLCIRDPSRDRGAETEVEADSNMSSGGWATTAPGAGTGIKGCTPSQTGARARMQIWLMGGYRG